MQMSSTVEPSFNIYRLSEQAITVEFGQQIDEQTLQQVSHFNYLINQNPFAGFYTTVPAYTTVTVFFDPLQVTSSPRLTGNNCFEKVSAYLISLKNTSAQIKIAAANTVTIPVCYGGEFGPDLDDVAAAHNLTTGQVIELHSKAVYKVYMIGFVPGFAYLGGMPPQLGMPRKQTPRSAVPAGSVGIAGEQTGIYPLQTPGGWQIIGRTPLTLFDTNRQQPSLLKAGDHVVFKPVDERAFNNLTIK